MKNALILSVVVSPLLVLASLQGGTVMRSGSGIQIGTSGRGTPSRGSGAVRGTGLKVGGTTFPNSTKQIRFSTTITTSTPQPPRFTYAPQSSVGNNYNITDLKVGMMVPYKSFGVRDYTKAVTTAINTLQKSTRGPRLGLFQRYDIHVRIAMKELTPSPTGPPICGSGCIACTGQDNLTTM